MNIDKRKIIFTDIFNFKLFKHLEYYYIVRDAWTLAPVTLIHMERMKGGLYTPTVNKPIQFETPRDALKFWCSKKNQNQIMFAFGYDEFEFLKGPNVSVVCDRNSLVEKYPELII